MKELATLRTDVVGSLLRPAKFSNFMSNASKVVARCGVGRFSITANKRALRSHSGGPSKYVPLEQIAVSPQCGFSSDLVGNLISEDDQKRKLETVVETARRVWR
jgi:5-methyltetrahydropteroyltriglutamate--homocysteine methyltransferase